MEINETLAEYRLDAAKASGGTSSEDIYNSIERLICSRRLDGRVLDYGAGVGNLTKRLLSLNSFERIAGADIVPRPVDMPEYVDWHCLDLNARLPVPDGAYDVVISSEVIEHLENPREIARDLYRVLKPGGTLVLTTPNNESWRSLVALVVRGHFVAFSDSCYPAHITALVRKDLERILMEVGFPHVEFSFTNCGGVPGHPVVTWQQISFGFLRGLRYSDNLLVTAVK